MKYSESNMHILISVVTYFLQQSSWTKAHFAFVCIHLENREVGIQLDILRDEVEMKDKEIEAKDAELRAKKQEVETLRKTLEEVDAAWILLDFYTNGIFIMTRHEQMKYFRT